MAVAILIGLWIYAELSFNKYHQNYDRIAKVMRSETLAGEVNVNDNHVTRLGALLKLDYTNHFNNVAMVWA
jgi:putative ABC transport system permease protein